MDIIIEIVGNNVSFFREITETDLRDIARTFVADGDLQQAHDRVWAWSKPIAIESTGSVAYSVIDDSDDCESSRESWEEVLEALNA